MQPQIYPGFKSVPANSTEVIQIILPAWDVKVSRIYFELTDLNATIEMTRTDTNNSITKGAVRAALLGAIVHGNPLPGAYHGPPPFTAEPSTTISFSINNKTASANACYISVIPLPLNMM